MLDDEPEEERPVAIRAEEDAILFIEALQKELDRQFRSRFRRKEPKEMNPWNRLRPPGASVYLPSLMTRIADVGRSK